MRNERELPRYGSTAVATRGPRKGAKEPEARKKAEMTPEDLHVLAQNLCDGLKLKEKHNVLKGLNQAISKPTPLSLEVSDYIEKYAKENGVGKENYRTLKKEIFGILKAEYEQEKEKNRLANVETLKEETGGQVRALLEQGRSSIDENADAVIEQLNQDVLIKMRVFELLKKEFEKGYQPVDMALLYNTVEQREKIESAAAKVTKRLFTLRDGKVAEAVYKKLKEERPKDYESLRAQEARILRELGLTEAFAEAEQALEPGLKAKGEFGNKMMRAYELIDEIKANLDDPQKAEKIKNVQRLTAETKAAMFEVGNQLKPIKMALEKLGKKLIGKGLSEKVSRDKEFILEKYQDLYKHYEMLPKPSYGSLKSIEEQYGRLYGEMINLLPFKETKESKKTAKKPKEQEEVYSETMADVSKGHLEQWQEKRKVMPKNPKLKAEIAEQAKKRFEKKEKRESTAETFGLTEAQRSFIRQAKELVNKGGRKNEAQAIPLLTKAFGPDYDRMLEIWDTLRSAASFEACYQAAQTLLEKIHKNK